MSERIFVRPAEGMSVPDLEEGPAARFPAEGKFATDSIYLRRRIADGSLIRDDTFGAAAIAETVAVMEPAPAATEPAAEPAPPAPSLSAFGGYRRRSAPPPAPHADPDPDPIPAMASE